MNRRYRRTIIAGNWKMNKTASETKAYAETFKELLPKTKWCDIVLCVPFVCIPAAARVFKDSRIAVGAQNVHEGYGSSCTGEVSAEMLANLDVRYVIVGHSDRRAQFGETDTVVNRKVRSALEAGLNPIICVGDTPEQREMGVTTEALALQVRSALSGVAPEMVRRCVFAYEPLWAAKAGQPVESAEAAEISMFIRATIRAQYGARVARGVTIQYGGTMNAKNAAEYFAHEDIDGGLVDSASLKPETLMAIVHAANPE